MRDGLDGWSCGVPLDTTLFATRRASYHNHQGQNQENQENFRVGKDSLDDREATLGGLEWKGRSGAGWIFFSWSRRDMEEERKISVT